MRNPHLDRLDLTQFQNHVMRHKSMLSFICATVLISLVFILYLTHSTSASGPPAFVLSADPPIERTLAPFTTTTTIVSSTFPPLPPVKAPIVNPFLTQDLAFQDLDSPTSKQRVRLRTQFSEPILKPDDVFQPLQIIDSGEDRTSHIIKEHTPTENVAPTTIASTESVETITIQQAVAQTSTEPVETMTIQQAVAQTTTLANSESVRAYLWASEDNEIMQRIVQHQFPKSCEDKNFLVYRLDRMSSRNVGSITRHVAHWLAEALIADRILVWGEEPWEMSDCDPKLWDCYFMPISSCTFRNLPPHTNKTEAPHDKITLGDQKHASKKILYAWRMWFRTTMGDIERLLKFDSVRFVAYAKAFLLRQNAEIKAAVKEEFAKVMDLYPDLDPSKTISMPMRRGDKCKGHHISHSASGEDVCLPLQTWVNGIDKYRCEKFSCDPDLLSHVIVTCGEEAVVRNMTVLAPKSGFEVVWNTFDVMQGTGSANDLQHFDQKISTKDVIISIFTNLQLQLRGSYFVKKKSRRYSSWISIIEQMMTVIPEMTPGEGVAKIIFLPKYAKEAKEMEESDKHPNKKKKGKKSKKALADPSNPPVATTDAAADPARHFAFLWASNETDIMQAIIKNQFPESCDGKKFLVYRLDHMKSRNVGSITRHVAHWIAEALIANRVLVWGEEPWEMADCDQKVWDCYFMPISSCTFKDLPPHTNKTEVPHDEIEIEDEKHSHLPILYAWRMWFRTKLGHIQRLLNFDGERFRAYAQAFLLRQNSELRFLVEYKFNKLMQTYPNLDPEKTISMPLRRGDKCKGHHIDHSAPGEDACLPLQTWIDGINRFRCEEFNCDQSRLSSFIVTCGEEAVVRNMSEIGPRFGWQVIWNNFDVMQGTGSANDLQHFDKKISTKDVMVSIFTNLQLQLRGKFFVKKKHRRYSSWISIIEQMMTLIPEMTPGETVAKVIFLPKYASEANVMEEQDKESEKRRYEKKKEHRKKKAETQKKLKKEKRRMLVERGNFFLKQS